VNTFGGDWSILLSFVCIVSWVNFRIGFVSCRRQATCSHTLSRRVQEQMYVREQAGRRDEQVFAGKRGDGGAYGGDKGCACDEMLAKRLQQGPLLNRDPDPK
jgi:hypothetical protein